jgi:tryptophan-rich sensory protein
MSLAEPRFTIRHAAAFAVGLAALSLLTSRTSDRRYYRRLDRPRSAPPAWSFPAIWGALNVLQLWGDLRLLNKRGIPDRGRLLAHRGVNWLLYALFTPAFFRARSPVLGEAVTLAQTANTLATLSLAARRAPVVAAALTPLLGWLGFASVTGGKIAWRNPDPVVGHLRNRLPVRPAEVTLH